MLKRFGILCTVVSGPGLVYIKAPLGCDIAHVFAKSIFEARHRSTVRATTKPHMTAMFHSPTIGTQTWTPTCGNYCRSRPIRASRMKSLNAPARVVRSLLLKYTQYMTASGRMTAALGTNYLVSSEYMLGLLDSVKLGVSISHSRQLKWATIGVFGGVRGRRKGTGAFLQCIPPIAPGCRSEFCSR